MAEVALKYGGNIAMFGPFGGGPGPYGGGPHGSHGPMGHGPMGPGGPMGPMRGFGFMGCFFSPHPRGGDGGDSKDPKDKKTLTERIGEFLAKLIY